VTRTSPLWADHVVLEKQATHAVRAGAIRVAGGARVTGAVADAIIELDVDEHARRTASGLWGVEDLALLDALLCLPFGACVPAGDIGAARAAAIERAPVGCVEWSDDHTSVRRVLTPVANVTLVVVHGATWRNGLRRASAFEPFARRVVLLGHLSQLPEAGPLEADALGIGVWARDADGSITELVKPAPWRQRYVKPAGWRFRERAYAAWVTAKPR
jgi:hypothetical protein